MKLLKLALALAFTLCLLEAGSRLLFPRPELENFNRIYYTPLALFGGIEKASTTFQPISYTRLRWESIPDGFSNVVSLNIYGFRGPDFPVRPASKPRVIFIGDSFAEGLGVDDDDTLPAQFERLAGGRYEVLNLGVSGTGLPEYARLARDSRVLRPSALVIVTSWNDLPVRPDWAVKSVPPGPIHPSGGGSSFLAAIDELRRGRKPVTRYFKGPFPFFRAVPDSSNPFSAGQNENSRLQTVADIAGLISCANFKAEFSGIVLKKAPLNLGGKLTILWDNVSGGAIINQNTADNRRTRTRLDNLIAHGHKVVESLGVDRLNRNCMFNRR